MKIHKIISIISALFILSFTNIACSSSDDDTSTVESSLTYQQNEIDQPVKDFYAFLNQDSQLVISAFSAKLPMEGIEDQIEDIYTKQNLILTLSKFEEGRFDFATMEAMLRIDTLFYSYSNQPYKISSLVPLVDSLDLINSFIYIKDIKDDLDLVSGNFRLHELFMNDTLTFPMLQLKYKVEGEFQHVPFTTYN